jgi:hypothetical protein
MPYCGECNEEIPFHLFNSHKRSERHKLNCCVNLEPNVKLVRTGFKGRIATYRLSTDLHHTKPELFLAELESKIITILHDALLKHSSIKVNLELFGQYLLASKNVKEMKSFNSRYQVISKNTDLSKLFENYKKVLTKKASDFEEKESGWALVKLLFLELNIAIVVEKMLL